MNGLATDCPSCREENPDAGSVSHRQGLLQLLEDSISSWGVFDELRYLSGCVQCVFN